MTTPPTTPREAYQDSIQAAQAHLEESVANVNREYENAVHIATATRDQAEAMAWEKLIGDMRLLREEYNGREIAAWNKYSEQMAPGIQGMLP